MPSKILAKKLKNMIGDQTLTKEQFIEKFSHYYKYPKDQFNWLLKQGIIVQEGDNLYRVNYDWFEQFKTKAQPTQMQTKEGIIDPNFTREYIPRKVGNTTDVAILKKAFENNLNVLLVGETGTGKTHAVFHVAKLLGRKVVRVNLDKATTPEDLIGYWQPADGDGKEKFRWIDGVLIEAMKNGYVFVCDEINAAPPEVLFLLNSVLDSRQLTLKQHKGETIKAHPNFVFVATMNPPTNYEGVNPLNPALRSRFQVVLYYDYDETIEAKLGLEKPLIDFAKKVRRSYKLNELTTPISTRDLIYYHNNSILFGREVAKSMLLSKFPVEERKAVEEVFELTVEKGGE